MAMAMQTVIVQHGSGSIDPIMSAPACFARWFFVATPCGVPMTAPTRCAKGGTVAPNEAQGDHIYPRSKGGDGATVEDQRNVRIICATCNNKKSDRIP